MNNIDFEIKNIGFKLRKIRELKGLTRESFCDPLGENSEYWGLIERGEQSISLVKLLQPIISLLKVLLSLTINCQMMKRLKWKLLNCLINAKESSWK